MKGIRIIPLAIVTSLTLTAALCQDPPNPDERVNPEAVDSDECDDTTDWLSILLRGTSESISDTELLTDGIDAQVATHPGGRLDAPRPEAGELLKGIEESNRATGLKISEAQDALETLGEGETSDRVRGLVDRTLGILKSQARYLHERTRVFERYEVTGERPVYDATVAALTQEWDVLNVWDEVGTWKEISALCPSQAAESVLVLQDHAESNCPEATPTCEQIRERYGAIADAVDSAGNSGGEE